jgi:galactonate dehydratase
VPKVTAIETFVVGSGRWQWSLVRLEADDGTIGWGEGSDCPAIAWESAVHDLFADRLLGDDVSPLTFGHRLEMVAASHLGAPAEGFVLRTAASALEQAAWDLHARSLGVPLATALGGRASGRVRVYANLNRGLLGGDPDDVPRVGAQAIAAGFDAVKCAPFNGIDAGDPDCDFDELLVAGLARVRALRDATTPARVYVDGHGRFDRQSAPAVAVALQEIGVAWFEDPVGPAGFSDAIDAVRGAATSLPLASGELLAGSVAYDALLSSAVDVVLTDVKHNGGHRATAELAARCRAVGRRLSLHNPAGPIAALHSAHAMATQPGCWPLEHAFSPERAERVERLLGAPEAVADGWLVVPDGPGIGVDPGRGDLLAGGRCNRSER